MQPLTKLTANLLIHILPTFQAGNFNQENSSDSSSGDERYLIKKYDDNSGFNLEKLFEDSKESTDFHLTIQQSYENFSIDHKNFGCSIAFKILKSFSNYNSIILEDQMRIYKCLLRIIISGVFDTIKYNYLGNDDLFFKNQTLFSDLIKEGKITIERWWFDSFIEPESLNFEQFLIAIGFDHNCTEKIFGRGFLDRQYKRLDFEKIFSLIRTMKAGPNNEDLENKFYCFIYNMDKEKTFERYISFLNTILKPHNSGKRIPLFEVNIFIRFIKFLKVENKHLLEDSGCRKDIKEKTQEFLDKIPFFNKSEEETDFSTEMFCLLYYLEIFDTIYGHSEAFTIYYGKGFLIKRIRKSKDYVIRFPSTNFYKEVEICCHKTHSRKPHMENFALNKITVENQTTVARYLKEMKLEKVQEKKTELDFIFISLIMVPLRNLKDEWVYEVLSEILKKEKNPENFRIKLRATFEKIRWNNISLFFQRFSLLFTRFCTDNKGYKKFVSCFDDVFIEKWKKEFKHKGIPMVPGSDKTPGIVAIRFFDEIYKIMLGENDVKPIVNPRFLILFVCKSKIITGEDVFLECSDVLLDKVFDILDFFNNQASEMKEAQNKEYLQSYGLMFTKFLKTLVNSNKDKIVQRKFVKRLFDTKKAGFILYKKAVPGSKNKINKALIYLYSLYLASFVEKDGKFDIYCYELLLKTIDAKSIPQILEVLKIFTETLFFKVLALEEQLNKNNSFIQKILLYIYVLVYEIFEILKIPDYKESRRECLGQYKSIFSRIKFDINVLVRLINDKEPFKHIESMCYKTGLRLNGPNINEIVS